MCKFKCSSCGDVFEIEYDEHGDQISYFVDKNGRKYCNQCWYDLYEEPFNRLLDTYCKTKAQERRRDKKLKRLAEIFGNL